MSTALRSRTTPPRSTRHRRRRLYRALLAGVLGAGLLALLGWVALGSGLLAVHRVTVRGAHLLTPAQARAAADVPAGSPMLTLDSAAIARRLTALPQVAAVRVERDWPSTVTLRLTERSIVAAVPTTAGADLVARDGVIVARGATVPPKLPLLQLTGGAAPSSASGRAALRVLSTLPAAVRSVVVAVSAATPASIQLALTGKRTVVWGSADFTARKAAVLTVLLHRPAAVYDVSSPDVATTR